MAEQKFGNCTFSHVENRNVYQNRNGKACVAIQVSVPVPALGLILETAIWGRFKSSAEGHEVSFEASLPKGLKAMRDDTTGREELLAHIETQAAKWGGYSIATDGAYQALTGAKPAKAPTVARPKLVYGAKAPEGQQPGAPVVPKGAPTLEPTPDGKGAGKA